MTSTTSEREIIGFGTWLDKTAYEVIQREKILNRSLPVIRTESGLGASGFPHIGSLGDATRAYGIKLAIQNMGVKSETIAFADDMDGLRKVPAGLPVNLRKYIGIPVSSIPDPFKCHDSYGRHMSSLLIDAIQMVGIDCIHISAQEVYSKGILTDQIIKILKNSDKAGEIIREETGQEKYVDALPYLAICNRCGRIYTTTAYEFLPKEYKVLYHCDGTELRGQSVEGCGYEGEADIRKSEGKLNWKVEFASRWAALKICFEAYGKDISDSVRVNDRICEEILGFPAPFHLKYEMFLDKGGRKISKSKGNVFTPQVWLNYGSPQSLLLLLFKRIEGTRSLSVDDIPRYMDEVDDLEDIYFGNKKVNNFMEEAKLKGLYKYIHLLKPSTLPEIHVPYRTLVSLWRWAPNGKEVNYIEDTLRKYDFLKNGVSEDLLKRIEYAKNWFKDFEEKEKSSLELSLAETNALEDLIRVIEVEEDPEKIQSQVFEIARNRGLKPRKLFRTIYMALIGKPRGPRLGSYIIDFGREKVVMNLRSIIHSK